MIDWSDYSGDLCVVDGVGDDNEYVDDNCHAYDDHIMIIWYDMIENNDYDYDNDHDYDYYDDENDDDDYDYDCWSKWKRPLTWQRRSRSKGSP